MVFGENYEPLHNQAVNVEALAEVTEDIEAKLDFYVEKYREGQVNQERLEKLMRRGD